jgi:beta-lactam-binding protein with PASTA domain
MSLFNEYPVARAVPSFVGLNYDEARPLELDAGVHIADEDPDAPPILNYWWEHKEMVVTAQSPAPGGQIDPKMTSVTVALGAPGSVVGAVVTRVAPPSLSAQASGDDGSDDALEWQDLHD